MAGGKASSAETQFAVYFLQRLGGDIGNPFLITAVIAWLRQESGGLSKVIGNNPFNIRHSSFAIGYRHTKSNGVFAIFKNLKAGAYATAQMLLNAGHDSRGYDKIVQAAQQHVGSDAAKQQAQGMDFLNYVAKSKWDVSHYGTAIYASDGTKGDEKQVIVGYDLTKNNLLKVWATITGIPAIQQDQPKQPKPSKAKPSPPPPLPPPSPGPSNYLDPGEPLAFYKATHKFSDLGNLPEF